jgi:hypothetical protein
LAVVRKLVFFTIIAALATPESGVVRADHMPTLRPDGAIVYGDWGLYRPGAMVPFVEGPYIINAPRSSTGYYFPTNRHDPAAYRSPRWVPPTPTEHWHRSWGVESSSSPATVYAPYDGASVIYAPNADPHVHKHHHDKKK